MPSSPERIDYLMVLRGLCAIYVVFCHLPFELHNWWASNKFLISAVGDKLDWILDPFGYIPVLIFFSLSGYLITLGFFTERHSLTSIAGVKRYYRSRALRILPLYYFSIVFCALLFFDLTLEFPLRVAQLFIFVENYKPANGIIFNHVYWTMPIEMLYFFAAPIIYIALKKLMDTSNPLLLFCLFNVLFLAIAYWIFYGLPTTNNEIDVDRKQWSLIARFDFFYNLMAFVLGGASVFIANNKKYQHFFLTHRVLCKLSVCVFIVAITAYSSTKGLQELNRGHLSYFMAFGLLPSIGIFMLCFSMLHETQSLSPKPYLGFFIHLGHLSYGIYLFHMPVLECLQRIIAKLSISITNEFLSLLVILVTIVLSQLTYKYIELPFLNYRLKFR